MGEREAWYQGYEAARSHLTRMEAWRDNQISGAGAIFASYPPEAPLNPYPEDGWEQTYMSGTKFENLPETIVRRCCPGKSCGTVTLYRYLNAKVKDGKPVLTYGYRRDNDDYYFGPYESVDKLIFDLNGSR